MDARTWRTGTRLGAVVAAALLAAACKGNGGAGGRISVAARTVTPAGSAVTAAAGGGLDLGDGITVSRVRLALRRIALEGVAADPTMMSSRPDDHGSGGGDDGGSGGGSGGMGGDDGGSGDDGSGDEDEVAVGPFAVDLAGDALSGGIHPVFDSDVPPGTYRELRIVVAPVPGAAAGTGLADLAGSSVAVEGSIDGAPFAFTSALTATQKVEMTIQIAADGSSSGVTLTVDPHGWFHAQDGSRLDPTQDASRAAIEDNLRASIGAELEDEHGGGADDGPGTGSSRRIPRFPRR